MATLAPYIFPQFFDNNGDPLNGGLIYAYAAGTVTPQDTYSNAAGTATNTNPVVLSSSGRTKIFLQPRSYDFVIRTSAGVLVDTISGVGGSGTGLQTSVDNLTELRSVESGGYDFVEVGGHSTVNDQGGGLFYWNASSNAADDNGIIIRPSSAPAQGRWVRLFSGPVNVKWYGAKGDSSTNDTTAMTSANAYVAALANGGTLFFPASSGSYLFTSNPSFSANVTVKCEDGAIFTSSSIALTIGGKAILGKGRHFANSIGTVTLATGSVPEILPQWWGAVGDAVTDCTTAIQAAITCSRSNRSNVKLCGGIYLITDTLVMNQNRVCLRGDGPQATQIWFNQANKAAIRVNSSSDPENIVEYWTIENIGFDCYTGTPAACVGIDIAQAPTGTLRNVWVKNYTTCIYGRDSYNTEITACKAIGARQYGIDLGSNCNDICLFMCTVTCDSTANTRGIRMESCHGVSIKGGAIEDCEWAVQLQASEVTYDGYIENLIEGGFLMNGSYAVLNVLNLYAFKPGTDAVFKATVASVKIRFENGYIAESTTPLDWVFSLQGSASSAYYGQYFADSNDFYPGGARFYTTGGGWSGEILSLVTGQTPDGDATIERDLTVSRNLSVANNLSVAGAGQVILDVPLVANSTAQVASTTRLNDSVALAEAPGTTSALKVNKTPSMAGASQYGIFCSPEFASAASGQGNAGYFALNKASAFAMTTGRALDIGSPTNAGGTTTVVGIQIRDQTGGTTNRSLKTGLGPVELGDRVLLSRSTFGDANATVPNNVSVCACNATLTASRTITLPSAATYGTGELVICDDQGSVTGANTLVVTAAGADVINGAATTTINAAYGYRRLMCDGSSKWTIVGQA